MHDVPPGVSLENCGDCHVDVPFAWGVLPAALMVVAVFYLVALPYQRLMDRLERERWRG